MTLIAVKVLLAPSFVVLASVAGRRFGVRIGGMFGGLPVVAGPILLVYALSHGDGFAAGAATGTLLGLVSLIGFVVVYAWLAGRSVWWLSLPGGWAAFAVGTLVFSAVELAPLPALCAMGLALLLALVSMPSPAPAPGPQSPRPFGAFPFWDLPMRAACALALVLVLTAAAGWLGPQLSGLLAPFPVIASVLSGFTHAQRGAAEVHRLLRGLLLGYVGFGMFCFVLAVSLRSLGSAESFALACGVALACQAAVLWRQRTLLMLEAPANANPTRIAS